jgi:hypothetical protein
MPTVLDMLPIFRSLVRVPWRSLYRVRESHLTEKQSQDRERHTCPPLRNRGVTDISRPEAGSRRVTA